ncbi:MAG: prolipoprotein diacylglyceryl transferase, partial [Bacillota bacterium]|nr:prolipoprotein diacylglyceryl transferase [Bacillota bacterium]
MYHVDFPGLGFHFTIDPVIFKIGIITVRWYGLLIAIGFLIAVLYGMKNAARFKLNSDKLFNCILIGAASAVICARLYYVIFSFQDYKDNLISILYINEGGLAIYGGIIGAFLGGGIYAKISKLDILPMFDIAVLGFCIGQAFGRWGNFFNQEAFGVQTNLPWRMVSENTGGVGVHPCFFYESLWCALGFVILHIVSKKWRKFDGQIFYMYLCWYGGERMFVESLRTDSLYLPFQIFGQAVRVSQMLSVILFVFGVLMLVI